MSSKLKEYKLSEIVDVTDYVANGSFASLKDNVNYLENGYAILARLVDHNSGWEGNFVYVDEAAYKFLSKSSLVTGDIIISNVGANAGTVFRIPYLNKPVTLGPNAVRVRSKSKILNNDFLYYYLFSRKGQDLLQSIITGSAQPKFNKTSLRGVILSIPAINDQEVIAELMRCIDDRITLLRETNTTLEAIAQALFKSWFVDFDPVHAKQQGRAPEGMDAQTAALFPDSFEESELGMVPKGWNWSTLAECTSYLNRGISPKYVEEGGIPVLNQKCIRDFSVDFSKARRHDPALRKIDGRDLMKGDVLVNSTGVGTLGRVAQLLKLDEPTIVDSHVTVVRAGQKINAEYLGCFMQWKQPNIEDMGEGSTGQTELSRQKLGQLEMLQPDEKTLLAFRELVNPLKERISFNEKSIGSLAQLRDTLLPRLISGQLHLPEAQALVEDAVDA